MEQAKNVQWTEAGKREMEIWSTEKTKALHYALKQGFQPTTDAPMIVGCFLAVEAKVKDCMDFCFVEVVEGEGIEKRKLESIIFWEVVGQTITAIDPYMNVEALAMNASIFPQLWILKGSGAGDLMLTKNVRPDVLHLTCHFIEWRRGE